MDNTNLILPAEEWRSIPNFVEFYEASSFGQIRGLNREVTYPNGQIRKFKQRVLKQVINPQGYPFLRLFKPDFIRSTPVHSLIAETFLGLRPSGYFVNHINGIKTDNRPENLEYVTCSENNLHALRTGLRKNSICNHNQCSLSDADVVRARLLNCNGIGYRKLSKEFGVSHNAMRLLLKRKTYKWVE